MPIPSSVSSEKRWREKEILKAIYVDRSVILADEGRDILGEI
jgi:hypothetical protein